jgi:tRNA G18 (ribose-2'-O)-methylase SpoU
VRIEMADGLDSLNVATASGIALHHFALPHRESGV